MAQGEKSDTLYFIDQGRVNLVIQNLKGTKRRVLSVLKGAFFGFEALFSRSQIAHRIASAEADGDVIVMVITHTQLLKMEINDKDFAITILGALNAMTATTLNDVYIPHSA